MGSANKICIVKHSLPLFLIYSFDNDDVKSSKRHATLLTLTFLLNCIVLHYITLYCIEYL